MDTLAADSKVPRDIENQKPAVERAPDDGSLRINMARLYPKAQQKGLPVPIEKARTHGPQVT